MEEASKVGMTEHEKQSYIAVSKALWRMDKANPDLPDSEEPWQTVKPEYLKRARRLVKSFEREGITLVFEETVAEA